MSDSRDVVEIYNDMRESYQGWCMGECQEVTRDCTEPDAEGYDCPECGEDTVVGADIFLMESM